MESNFKWFKTLREGSTTNVYFLDANFLVRRAGERKNLSFKGRHLLTALKFAEILKIVDYFTTRVNLVIS